MIMKSYQVRMYNEYVQLCERYKKLINILKRADDKTLDFVLNTPLELLKEQADVMKRYIDILKKRSLYEHMELPEFDFYIDGGEEYGII